MKKNYISPLYALYCLFMFFCSSVKAENGPPIVFVHVGNNLPAYINESLSQARLFNKDSPIILVANEIAVAQLSLDTFKLNLMVITCESLKHTPEHCTFLEKSNLNRNDREAFWLRTSERFLYVQDLMNQYELQDVFHLENDNMLYVDLKELLPIFSLFYHDKIAATFDNDQRCIPGFVYIPNRSAIDKLAKCFAIHASEGMNDMQLLATFKNETNLKEIDHLPIIMPEYVQAFDLVSDQGHRGDHKELYNNHFEVFNSIFDAAALGQYLGGTDPAGANYQPGFINESCVFNPSRLNFQWVVDESNRAVPYASFAGTQCRINNLHIHSKKLIEFSSINPNRRPLIRGKL